jgi:hypothetical protein
MGSILKGKEVGAELFEYGGIRYNALLRPSVDGSQVEDEVYLNKHDYASRTQLEKTDRSPSKAVSIEGRTVDGVKGVLAYAQTPLSDQPHPGHILKLSYLSHTHVGRLERLDDEIFRVEYEERQYCLKTVYSNGGGANLKREISTLQRCHHPHIIPIHSGVNDSGKVEGKFFA